MITQVVAEGGRSGGITSLESPQGLLFVENCSDEEIMLDGLSTGQKFDDIEPLGDIET